MMNWLLILGLIGTWSASAFAEKTPANADAQSSTVENTLESQTVEDREMPPGMKLLPSGSPEQRALLLRQGKQLYESGKGRRDTGIVLTILGAAGSLAGGLVLALGTSCPANPPGGVCALAEIGPVIGGLVTLGLSVPIGVVGLALWGSGSNKMNRAQKMGYDPSISLGPMVVTGGSQLAFGLGVLGRF